MITEKKGIAPHLSVWEEHDGVDVGLVPLEGLHALSLPDIPHLSEHRGGGGGHGDGGVNESLDEKKRATFRTAISLVLYPVRTLPGTRCTRIIAVLDI